jgi:prophage endopeptidase
MTALFKLIPVWLWVGIAAALAIWLMWSRLEVVAAERDLQIERVGQLTAANESRKKTQKLLLDLDTAHALEQAKADETNTPMLTAVATGAQRVYVKASCPAVRAAPIAPGKPDEEGRAELDPATAERILHTGVDGDDAIRQLTALQDYVSKVCMGGSQ